MSEVSVQPPLYASPQQQQQLIPPQQLQRVGPYILGKTLGVGSTGRVKLGTHSATGKTVAVKIINKAALASTPDLLRKIEREIAIMKLIDHPNVMSLYDVYESMHFLFLILEHVEGGELFDYLVKRGRLPNEEALKFFRQIMSAVDFCHKHSVCHRDLKPENLLLDGDRNIKIADFGMASLQVNDRFLETSCGSPHYASPEVIKGVKYDGHAADVWSCGIILFALLTGNLPFDDDNIHRLLNKVKSGEFVMPQFLRPECKDLIERMLTVDPEKRIPVTEVLKHPWYISTVVPMPETIPSPLPAGLIPAIDDVDEDIMFSMRSLGCFEDEASLTLELMSSAQNVAKVIYYLLSERKRRFPSLCDIPDNVDNWNDVRDPNVPRKRTDSFSGDLSDYTPSSGSPVLSPASSSLRVHVPVSRTSSATPSSSNPNSPRGAAVPFAVVAASAQPAPLAGVPGVSASSYTPMPPVRGVPSSALMSTSLPSSPIPKPPTSAPTSVLASSSVAPPSPSPKQNSSLSPSERNSPAPEESKAAASADGTHPTLVRVLSDGKLEVVKPVSPPAEEEEIFSRHHRQFERSKSDTAKLRIRRQQQQNPNESECSSPPEDSTVGAKKRFGGLGGSFKSKLALNSSFFTRRRNLSIERESPPSPSLSSSPKRSWFGGFFSSIDKDDQYVLSSSKTVDVLKSELERAFAACDIKFNPFEEKEQTYKAKFQGQRFQKTLKFVVRLTDTSDNRTITFTLTNGGVAAFKVLFDRIDGELKL